MIISYEFPGIIQYSSIKYDSKIITPRSLVCFPDNVLYREKELLEGVVPHLLGVTPEYCSLLRDLLHKYCDVFPRQLPKKYHRIGNWQMYT